MSWIRKRINEYVLKTLGPKAIFDQDQTLEIKKKNDYYETQLGLPDVLGQLSTPAPVVGDITTMTDPMPAVRLPRIPYYEYIYYLMRWNSSVLRMIGLKLKQEIFRETRLQAFDWEGKFKVKCEKCGTEHESKLEQCDQCGSKKVRPPDPLQKKILEPFIVQSNKAEQTFLEVCEEIEDDLNTVDDSYMIFVKDYYTTKDGLFGKVKEIMRGDTSRFRIVSDIAGRRGGKWWVCPAHRKSALKTADYKNSKVCEECGLALQEVHYVETTAGGVTPQKYYIAGEVVHASKYEPSRLYGIPPIFSVYIVARTIQLMDLYTEELYEKGRLKGLLGIATENKTELKKWLDDTMSKLRTDPHYLPVIALDVGPDRGKSRMEFVKLIDNMDELRFHEHRKMLKEEIAGLFGVNLIFLADSSTGGGLNNEGLQITVTDRTVEWGQSVYHDQFFPKLLEFLNITDWRLKLKPSKETDEMAELERFDLRVETATKLQNMGYGLKLIDDKFEVSGEAFTVDKPDPMAQFGGGQDQGQLPQGKKPEQKRLTAGTQEGKPEKPKPEKEIKRSLEKGSKEASILRLIDEEERKLDGLIRKLGVQDPDSPGFKADQKKVLKVRAFLNELYAVSLPRARKLDEEESNKSLEKAAGRFYNRMTLNDFLSEFNKRVREIKSIKDPDKRDKLIDKTYSDTSIELVDAMGDLVSDKTNRVAVTLMQLESSNFDRNFPFKKSLEKATCRGRIPTTPGFHPYYCMSEKVNFHFFVDKDKQAWYIGAYDENDKDISKWVTLGNVKTAFGWYGQELKDGRNKYWNKSLEKADEYTKISVQIDNLYDEQIVNQKKIIGLEQDLRPLERQKKRWQSRHTRTERGDKQDKILDDLRQLEHKINDVKQKIRTVNQELKQIDKHIDHLIRRRSNLLKSLEKSWAIQFKGRGNEWQHFMRIGGSKNEAKTILDGVEDKHPDKTFRIVEALKSSDAEKQFSDYLGDYTKSKAVSMSNWSEKDRERGSSIQSSLTSLYREARDTYGATHTHIQNQIADYHAELKALINKYKDSKKSQFADSFLGEFTTEEIKKGLLPLSIIKRICSYLSFVKAEQQVDPECLASELSSIAAKNPGWSKNQILSEAMSKCSDNESKKAAPITPKVQVFELERVNDESGQSGTGIVLSGIVFEDGKVVVRWNTETASTTEFDSWDDFEAIHISKHPKNETKVHFWHLSPSDTLDFAKSVVERGKDVITEYREIENSFAKRLEQIYNKKLTKKISKLTDFSGKKLNSVVDLIINEATPLIEKVAFSEVLRAYKKGKRIDESRDVSKAIDLPEYIDEPFKAEYGAFGIDKDDWQVLRAIYRQNPFWDAFTGMSQSVSDKLKAHITESYEAPNTARMKATIRDVKAQYPDIPNARAESIAYGRIGKFSIAKILTMMKRTINAETYRLERIARTETTAVTSKGREMAFKQTDPKGEHTYDWFGPHDKRNSDECPEIKRRIKAEGKGKGVSLQRIKEIQKDVVAEKNRMRKTAWVYRDWVPHANCRHGLRRIV